MLTLLDNHILNLKVSQIARILLKMSFKIFTVETEQMFEKIDFLWRLLPFNNIQIIKMKNNL